MAFKHRFERKPFFFAKDLSVFRWSLTITCTNWLMGETVDIGLFPSDGSQPWYFRGVHFDAGKSYRFDKDSVNWIWHQGDYAAILGSNDKILQKFEFRLREYGPGECPECHGTKKCRKCGGKGYIDYGGTNIVHCDRCNGGTCPTCDVPYRKPNYNQGPTGLKQF